MIRPAVLPRLAAAALTAAAALAGAGGCRAEAQKASPSPAAPAAQTDEDKTFYALGMMLGRNVRDFALTPAQLAVVQKGFTDAAQGKEDAAIDLQTYGPRVRQLAQAKQAERASAEKAKGVDYLARAAAEPGAEKLPSGVVFKELAPGTGASPAKTDTVRVHYRGTLLDGKEFDSSHKRGQPAEFRLDQVISCWTEGVQKMKQGGKARLVCPSDSAYGERGTPGIPPASTLVFEVELLAVNPGAVAK